MMMACEYSTPSSSSSTSTISMLMVMMSTNDQLIHDIIINIIEDHEDHIS